MAVKSAIVIRDLGTAMLGIYTGEFGVTVRIVSRTSGTNLASAIAVLWVSAGGQIGCGRPAFGQVRES